MQVPQTSGMRGRVGVAAVAALASCALLEGNRKLFVENDAWVAEVLAGLAKLDAAYLK